MKSKGETERYTQLNTKFQRITREDKTFFNEQCKEVEANNRIGKNKDLFKKTGDIKGTFHARMGTIMGKNDKDLKEAEEIKKSWQEYTEGLSKKGLAAAKSLSCLRLLLFIILGRTGSLLR